MAGVKISALPAVAAGVLTDVFPVVQGGVTSKETLQQVLTLFNANIQIDEAQVNNLLTDLANRLQLAGGTMTGNLTLAGDPSTALMAATKQYVDSIAEGLHFHESCDAATTANLAGYVYANGAAGVGATLTAGANGAFSTDGVSPPLNARILVAFQTTQTENGIYVLSQVGDGANPAILTRALDYDQPAEIDVGDAVIVETGTLYTGTIWFQTATVVTIGVSNIVFTLTNSAANINAGVGLTKTGNTIDLDVPVDSANGGTGVNNGTSTMTIGGNFAMSGAFTYTGTITGNTAVTFPTSGTLATLTAIGRLIGCQAFTANGTWTPTSGTTTAIIHCVGGGGGGGGSGTAAGGTGGTGGTSSVGALCSATGGAGGGPSGGGAGLGGVGSGGQVNLSGSLGGTSTTTADSISGPGGGSFLSQGAPGIFNVPGANAAANTGGGASGGGGNNATFGGAGSGGGGGTAILYATGITGTYAVTIGAGGTAGGAGVTGHAGGVGGSGLVYIFEFT